MSPEERDELIKEMNVLAIRIAINVNYIIEGVLADRERERIRLEEQTNKLYL